MIKAVFFDVDGTLVSHAMGGVPDSAKRALEMLREKGIYIFVATGRHRSELEETGFLQNIAFDGYIGINGQFCWDDTGMMYTLCIDPRDVQKVLDVVNREPFSCAFVVDEGLFVNYADDYAHRAQGDVLTDVPPVGDLNALSKQPVYQIVAFAGEQIERKLTGILTHCVPNRWNPCGVDFLPQDGGKQNGIAQVIERFGITRDECMAFGDGLNDISMLRAVGLSVAMGNADDCVKAEATYVTDTVERDGVAKALKHFGLI